MTNLEDRWVWDLNGEGVFRVKDLRNLLDESFLPKDYTATRWVKSILIKINVFAWKVYLDRLPTRLNLIRRGVHVPSLSCPVCNAAYEDMSHLLFSCNLANDVVQLVCRWWNLTWLPLGSYSEWLSWFNSIRICSRIKGMLEGVFYVTWCAWPFCQRFHGASGASLMRWHMGSLPDHGSISDSSCFSCQSPYVAPASWTSRK
nr:RNA-directed DNA polymerase, eukaryota [Tanacetum cinerariifolium]